MTISIRKPNEKEQKRKAVCSEQLAQDRQVLLMKWPFIGGIILRMELVPVRDDRLDTACTDGNSIFVDINFYSGLSREERLFVLAHEVWHCVLLHFTRRGNRDRELFNIAADLEIHFTLLEEKMTEPYILPHDPSWRPFSAEEIYEKLLKNEQKNQQSRGTGKDYNGKGKRPDGGFDKHIYQGEETEKNGASDEKATAPEEADQNGPNKEYVRDDDYTPVIAKDAAEQIRGRVVTSIQQMERTRGTVPSHLRKILEKLLKPSLSWQELLKQFVTSCYGGKRRWLPPSRRHVWQDLYLPSMRTEHLKATVAIDTSGSTQSDLGAFFGELSSLLRSFGKFELTVIQCDAAIQNVEYFSDSKLPEPDHQWEIKGCGGTDFRPVFDYIRKEKISPDILLFFTDGHGLAPEEAPEFPVLWILTKYGSAPCSWGKKVFLKGAVPHIV